MRQGTRAFTCILLAWAAVAGRTRGAEVQPVRPWYGEPPAPTEYANPDLLVSTERLAVLLGDGKTPPGASLVVIDARSRDAYELDHMVGAFHIESDTFQEAKRLPYCLVSPDRVANYAKRFGIGPKTKVVIYDAHASRLAARVWFTFWAYGHNGVCILEGGYNRWKDELRAVTDAVPAKPSKPGTWVPADEIRSVCSLEELKALIVPRLPRRFPPTLILDARSNAEYAGKDVRGRAGGHVPGAVNLPWDAIMKPVPAKVPTPRLKGYFVWRDPTEIYAMLRAAGLTPKQRVAVYDQSGGRSAHLTFSLYLMGFTRAVNYNAGWREYGSRDDAAIER
jgi:thiosulfate/3-mercaptopyruvate sulfurtransferase